MPTVELMVSGVLAMLDAMMLCFGLVLLAKVVVGLNRCCGRGRRKVKVVRMHREMPNGYLIVGK